jgi:hypothetical protein
MDYTVSICERLEIKEFVEQWHYSKSINGVISDYCFKLLDKGKLIGAMIFGRMAMANQWKKYAKQPTEVIELRRLCCIDDTKKNTESYFISKCIKWLRMNTKIKIIVSYADPFYSHSGIIYKASSFDYLGQSNPGKFIMYNGKKYHDKTIRTKYKGKLKPYAERIKQALDVGDAKYINVEGKHIYIKHIRKKRHRKE